MNWFFPGFYALCATGDGKTPLEWRTVVSCLKTVKLIHLANIIEREYSTSGKTDNSPRPLGTKDCIANSEI